MIFILKYFLIFFIIFFVNLSCEIFFLICSFRNFLILMIWQCVYSSCLSWFTHSIVCSFSLISLLMKSDLLLRIFTQLLSFFLQCWMMKSYSARVSAYHACHSFNFLIVMKYCRFLWSDLMIVWCFASCRYALHCFSVLTIASISLSWTSYCYSVSINFCV